MVCIYNPSTEQLNALDRYSDVLGSEEAAYYVLSLNNGFPLDKTPQGEDSDLYNDLVNHYGNEEEAIRTKAMLYTNRYLEANGDWTIGDFFDPSLIDSKNEPKLSFVTGSITDEIEEIMNHLFLVDPLFPSIEQDDLSKISPEENLSDYAVELLIKMSYDQYIQFRKNEFKKQNPSATLEQITEESVRASRSWYNRKINSILNEQVRALAKAFGLVYKQRPNGAVEITSKGRNASGVKELRLKFLNSIVHDTLENEELEQILGQRRLSKRNTLLVEGAKEYMKDAILMRRKNDRMIAASTLINVSLTGGTSTTINKSLAYHYISMFKDAPLIQAALEAVKDEDDRSEIYLVNKLVDIITTPAFSDIEGSSYVGRVFKQGVTQEMFDSFWDEFDELLNLVITKGVNSEAAKKKILSVVTAAFITNDQYNIYTKPHTFMRTAPMDIYAEWYSTKYKPWGELNDKLLSEIELFFDQLETYYKNKIKRQERDVNTSAKTVAETSMHLYELQKSDTSDPDTRDKLIEDLLNFAYVEIRDARLALQNLDTNFSRVNDKFSHIGTIYSDVVSFYNYIINTQLGEFFNPVVNMFPRQAMFYNAVQAMLKFLDSEYRNKLLSISEQFVDSYVDKYMDKNLVTLEQIRIAKENLHLQLKNNAIYGDESGYDLYFGLASRAESHLVRIVHDSLMRLNFNRDDEVRKAGIGLIKKLKAAKKSLLTGGLSWLGYSLGPKNFLILFQERLNDGTPSGMFTRRLHYGNFFKMRSDKISELVRDIEKKVLNETGNIYYKMDLDDYGNPIFPEGPEWDSIQKEYAHKINLFECLFGNKRFLLEYYDMRIDELSRDAISLQNDIQTQIDIIEQSATEDGNVYLNRLNPSELGLLMNLYLLQDNLSNEYTLTGEKKTGRDLLIARQIKAFRQRTKDRILYETDWDKYEKAKNSITDPAELAKFERLTLSKEINPKFWEIYKILQKEYRDLFPSYLDSAFKEIEELSSELNDIVNTVKKKRGFVLPNLRELSDAQWERIKELDDAIEAAYEPIIMFKKSVPKDSLIPSAFQRIAEIGDVMDPSNPTKTMYDSFMDEAKAEDIRESNHLGYIIHTHENEAYDKYTRASWRGDIPLSVFGYMRPSIFPDDVKARFGIDDSFEYILQLPHRSYNKLVDPDSSRYAKPSLVNKDFDPNENTYVLPKEENPAYKVLESGPKEVFDLYKECIELKKRFDSRLAVISPLSLYKLPLLRAADLAILSRIFFRGPLATLQECITNKVIANETDEEIIDEFTTLPDGTRVNSVPLKFVDNLKDMSLLTTDVVGAVILYCHMASNYYYKQLVSPLYQALLSQVGQDSYVTSVQGINHLILGKTTNQYAKLKNVIDNLLYDQKQLLGERGSLKLTGKNKTVIKAAKLLGKVGTFAALSRNTLSQTTGFFDADGKLKSFAFSGESFGPADLTFAIATLDKYLITGQLIMSTGEILPDTFIAAMMQKNGLGGSIEHKYQGGYKSKIRRLIGMERSGMGGFRVSDYIINALIALSIYHNKRLLGNEFLSEESFKNKLRREGRSKKEIDKAYDSAVTLLDAYGFKQWTIDKITFKNLEFNMIPSYANLLGKENLKLLEQNVAKECKTWAPMMNGAVGEEDQAVVQQNVLSRMAAQLRSYLINEFSGRFVNGYDFQDPNMSERKLNILIRHRDELVKIYKSTPSDNKKLTKLLKLYSEKSELETQLRNLHSSGDEQSVNWSVLRGMVGISGIEGLVGSAIGSQIYGTTGAIVGGILGASLGAAITYSHLKTIKHDASVFRSKIKKLQEKIDSINAKISAYDAKENKDLLLIKIRQLNELISEIKQRLNKNQGFYDYARGIVTNGSNRLAGRLLMNIIRNARFFLNQMLPQRLLSLKDNTKMAITKNQIKGLKRIAYDLLRIGQLWLITTYLLSWYRYDDGRAFLGGAFNDQTTWVMHKSDDVMRGAIRPVMESDVWNDSWEAIHESSTEGLISKIPVLNRMIEKKSDAMLGFNKKVSRKTNEITRYKEDNVERQINFIKAFGAVLALKVYSEGITPYDYLTVNDLTNAVSATLNVMTKEVEAGQKMISDKQLGTLLNPMLGGPYSAYFNREEYGHAHSWMRPFGYPSWFEQSDEIGLVNRMNFLSNTGLNKITIPKKESFSKKKDSGKKKLKKKKHLKKKK